MDAISVFTTALEFEKKIRDLYLNAVEIVDDNRGRSIFTALAEDEQSHVDFLEQAIATLRQKGTVSAEQLRTKIPATDTIQHNIEAMKHKIPERMLGDVKRVLSSALQLEIETTEFYREAFARTEGEIKAIFDKFIEIEQRHTDVVRFELDYASRNGFWFDFMEKSMEVGW